MKLTTTQIAFMGLLTGGPLSRKDLPPVLTRTEDRERQAIRRAGYVSYETGTGWRLTPAGREALESQP